MGKNWLDTSPCLFQKNAKGYLVNGWQSRDQEKFRPEKLKIGLSLACNIIDAKDPPYYPKFVF
jgi:hypothetical protein